LQPEPSRFIKQVAPSFFSRFFTALLPVPAFKLTPLFNNAAKHTRRLSKFIKSAGGRAPAFASRFFIQSTAAQTPKTIPATTPRLRSRWKTKNFFKPFR
jgi:hypothetical protein